MTFRPTVTVAKEAACVEWLGRLGMRGLFDGRHRFELQELSDDRTLLVHSESFSGLLVRLMRKSLDSGTLEGSELMNQALKERAEAMLG